MLLPLTLVAAAPALPAVPGAQRQIVAAMEASAAGWNAGDLDRFMAVYSDSPETSFVTKQGLIRGKAAIAERIRSRYDLTDAAKRGTLTFRVQDFRMLTAKRALYIAMYALTYADGRTVSGPTSLVFARDPSGWRIVADHSS